jgi:hypothetical protein
MNKDYYRENLPMFINGNLSAEEQADFERELSQDDSLKKEAEFLTAIRGYVKQENVQTPGEMGWHKLKRQIKKESTSNVVSHNAVNKWRTFAVAASLVLVVQAGFMATMMQQQDTFAPLSGDDYSENVIQIQFNSNAKASDIQQLLISINGSIIEGPSTKGLYRIQLKKRDDAIMNDNVIKQLQLRSDVIDFVSEE